MKRIFLFCCFLFCFAIGEAQNLVPNWSFEDTLTNPTWTGFIPTDCALWQSPPPGPAAYDNDNGPVPGVASWYQVPHTGAAWALMYTNTSLYGNPNWREILQVQLIDTLQVGKRYCVSFFVSRYDYCNYACNNIGALLSSFPLANGNSILTLTPTINNDPFVNPLLSDTTWLEVSGSFVAAGNEQWIIIGNFNNDANSDTVFTGVAQMGADYSAYIIDDVSVTRCDDTVITTNDNLFVPNAFSPNGDGNNDVLFVRGQNIKELHFSVYDRWGEKVFETSSINEGWDGTFNGEKMESAVFAYYLTVTYNDGKTAEKKGNVSLVK